MLMKLFWRTVNQIDIDVPDLFLFYTLSLYTIFPPKVAYI